MSLGLFMFASVSLIFFILTASTVLLPAMIMVVFVFDLINVDISDP